MITAFTGLPFHSQPHISVLQVFTSILYAICQMLGADDAYTLAKTLRYPYGSTEGKYSPTESFHLIPTREYQCYFV